MTSEHASGARLTLDVRAGVRPPPGDMCAKVNRDDFAGVIPTRQGGVAGTHRSGKYLEADLTADVMGSGLMAVFTLGVWTVKEGDEDNFVRAWHDFAGRTKEDFPDATATLLRDRDQPNRFVSFGPWESLDQIERWRSSEMFQEGVGRIRDLLEGFVPSTLDVAVEV